MGDDIEVQLKELRKNVEEDRESRIAYEEARTAESKAAEQKAAYRAAEQTKQFDQMMRMMARLDQGRLEKEKQDGQSRETSAAGDEDEAPALPASGDSECCARRGWPAKGPTWREWARPRLRSLW